MIRTIKAILGIDLKDSIALKPTKPNSYAMAFENLSKAEAMLENARIEENDTRPEYLRNAFDRLTKAREDEENAEIALRSLIRNKPYDEVEISKLRQIVADNTENYFAAAMHRNDMLERSFREVRCA